MTTEPEPPTLWKLNTRWIVGVGPRKVHRRYVGGRKGQRWATDGGQMVIISESEFARANSDGWGSMDLHEAWDTKAGLDKVSRHRLAEPDEAKPTGSGIALRYGCCWLAGHYVAVALKYGGTVVEISGRVTEALVPGVSIIMPIDMDRDDEESES